MGERRIFVWGAGEAFEIHTFSRGKQYFWVLRKFIKFIGIAENEGEGEGHILPVCNK